jgi:bile acid-coenzyme A ligase
LVSEYRVSYLATVPTIMQRLLPVYRADPGAYDLSSMRRWWHLAAPCPPAIKEAWIDILGPEVVWELYGGTELQALTFISGTEWLDHRGSVGRVVSGEMKVLDDDGAECPPGVVGEIYMRPRPGSQPTYRYIGSTAKQRSDALGAWDSLGDLGWFDAQGYLYLADRRVDMFTVGGRNVYPAEIENALAEHPAVLSCLVVGVPHEDLGQVPHALVHAESADLDETEVAAFVAQRLAAYKVPRSVEFVDTPLRDDAGKARRTEVRHEVIARRQAPGYR